MYITDWFPTLLNMIDHKQMVPFGAPLDFNLYAK